MVLRMVAVTARITTELEELKRAPHSSTVWKLHADSLVVLLDLAKRIPEAVERLASAPSQSTDQQESNESLRVSLEKLRARTSEAEKLIANA